MTACNVCGIPVPRGEYCSDCRAEESRAEGLSARAASIFNSTVLGWLAKEGYTPSDGEMRQAWDQAIAEAKR
jgi:hypothetical protein